MKWLLQFVLLGLMDAATAEGAAPAGETAPDAGAPGAQPTPEATPIPDPAAVPDTSTPDVMAALEEAEKGLGPDDPTPDPAAPAQIPAEYENLTQISSFVQTPQQVEQAIRAADEVWSVATGEKPARSLLEGMRAANPQGFQAVVNDLVPYLEQVTGKKFGGDGAAPDPVQQRLAEIESRFQQQEEARQQAIRQQQVQAADERGYQFISEKLKGTFAEGMEQHVGQMVAQKLSGNPQAMQEILSGNTATLEKALRAVQREEVARLKQYNANLVKQYRTLRNAVPASKGAPADSGVPSGDFPAYLEGETPVQYAARIAALK